MCVCVFVWLRISLLRIKLSASNFAWQFIGVQGRESHIFVNFAPPEAQNRTNQPMCTPRPPGRIDYGCVDREIARRVDVGSACVDIRPSSKMDVLVDL